MIGNFSTIPKDSFKLRKALKEESSEAYQIIFRENYKQLMNISDYAFSYRPSDMVDEPFVKFRLEYRRTI